VSLRFGFCFSSAPADRNGRYIIAVNASIVADSGGTCICESTEADPICLENQDYLLCKGEIKRDLITATAAISAFGSFFLGLLSNM
jgi:AGZA family xanthine/uracil permease-like MFS transporter